MNKMAVNDDALIKRLYRESLENVKYLDRTVSEDSNLSLLFEPKTLSIRNKLCTSCEKIMLLRPLFGKRAEGILWRKCFYEPINRVRRISAENIYDESTSHLYHMHLMSATGYYYGLLAKLQREFNFTPCQRMDVALKRFPSNIDKCEDEFQNGDFVKTKHLREFAQWLTHKVFVYLGDLARYLQEFERSNDYVLSEHYYHLALSMKPYHGQPYNQLGMLYSGKNFGLDSCFCYLRCVFSAESFMGADGNLMQLLTNNRSSFEKCRNQSDEIGLESECSTNADLKCLITGYLRMFQIFYDDAEDSADVVNLDRIMEFVLAKLDLLICNLLCAVESSPDFFLLKIIVSQMIVLKKLRDKGSCKLNAALRFMTSFLTIFFKAFCTQLAACPFEIEAEIFRVALPAASIESQQKPADHDSHSNGTHNFTDDVIEMSDSENDLSSNASSPSQCSIPVEADESAYDKSKPIENSRQSTELCGDNFVETKETSLLIESDASNIIDPPVLTNEENSSEYGTMEHIRPLIIAKVVCDWLKFNVSLFPTTSDANCKMWKNLGSLFNLLPKDDDLSKHLKKAATEEENTKKDYISTSIKCSNWHQTMPFIEDIYLRGIPSLTQAHTNLRFDNYSNEQSMSQIRRRVFCVRSEIFHLSKLVPIIFAPEQSIRTKSNNYSKNDGILIENSMENGLSDDIVKLKRQSLMKRMAKLRLKAEVSRIDKLSWIPVYLIIDSRSICFNAPVLKRLLMCRKFVLVVATKTLDRLDTLKSNCSKAREAVRWLETQLLTGKFIRAQKSNETTQKWWDFTDSDKASNTEMSGVLDFSIYLSNTVSDCSSSTVTCILTENRKILDDDQLAMISDQRQESKAFDYTTIYGDVIKDNELSGIAVENTRSFADRWFKHDANRKRRAP